MSEFTDEKLAELENICEAATPDWFENDLWVDAQVTPKRSVGIFSTQISPRPESEKIANVRFAVAARAEFQKAIMEIRGLRWRDDKLVKEIRTLRAAVDEYAKKGWIARNTLITIGEKCPHEYSGGK